MFSSMLGLLITLVIQTQCEEVVVSSSAAEQQQRVISSLTKSITYMKENNDKLNLDAITGLRIIQGQLEGMNKERNPQIHELHQLVTDAIELALPAVISYEPAYYKQLARLVDNDFWQSPLPVSTRQEEDQFMKNIVEQLLLQTDTELSGDPWGPEEMFDETLSDHCIQQLINKKCNISLSCVNMMTAPGAEGYAATHQVYYFIIMIQAGCVSNSTQAIIHEITNSLCAAIYMQAMSEPKGGDIAKDLFMEQVGLCGLAGYSNLFSRHDWVDMIISWQRPEGCFGNMENFLSEIQNIDERDRFKRSSSYRHGSALTRIKREERIMNDGCLCHRTTVAALALIQNYKSLHEITSANQIFKNLEQKPQTNDGRPEDILQKLLG